MKKWMLFSIMMAFPLLLSACSYKDIDKRIFVQAIGVDYTEDEEKPYKITLKLSIPTGSIKETEGTKYAYISKESESLANAIRVLKTHVDKEIDFGHARVIVLGQNLLSIDINKFMDVFYRRRDIQMISWVAIGKPSAEAVLKTEPTSEMAASSSLPNFFGENGVESAYIVSTPLFDLRRRSLENGIDALLPIIETDKDNKVLKVNQSVILANSQNHLYLTSEETKLYNLLAKNTNKFHFHVEEDDTHFTMAVDNTKVKYKIKSKNQAEHSLKMDVRIAGIIEESYSNLSDRKLPFYGKQAEKTVERELIAFLKKLQKHEMDPIGFGLRYKATRLHKSDLYKEWEKSYPDIALDVSVKASIKSTGTIE